MLEAGTRIVLRHEAPTAIHQPDRAVTAPPADNLPPDRTAPVVAMQQPIAVTEQVEAIPEVRAITIRHAQVLAAIRHLHLRLALHLHPLETIQAVTEQQGPALLALQVQQEQHHRRLRPHQDRRIAHLLQLQLIRRPARHPILHPPVPVPVPAPVLAPAPALVLGVARAAVVAVAAAAAVLSVEDAGNT